MEGELGKLSLNQSSSAPTKRLESNVFKTRTKESAIVHRYQVKVERASLKGKKTVSAGGPDPLRLIKSRLTEAAVRHLLRDKEGRFIFDFNDRVFSNVALADTDLSMEVLISSLDVSADDKRVVLHDSSSIFVTMKPDGGLDNIPSKINTCDCEENDVINFYSALLKSAAPTERFITLRGGRLFDITTITPVGYGIERMKGIKMGCKLIGKDDLCISLDIDSREGSFFKTQSLFRSCAEYLNLSEDQIRLQHGDVRLMKRLSRFVRDTPVRLETTDRIFSASGIRWDEGRGGERFYPKWSDVSDEMRQYGSDPVVVEVTIVGASGEGQKTKTVKAYHPLSALHLLPYTRTPLSKQDKIKPPRFLLPNVRYELIKEARKNIKIDHQNDNLEGFETEVATVPVYPMSEILPAPMIGALRNGQMIPMRIDPMTHKYDSNSYQFVVPAHIRRFQIVYDRDEINEANAKIFFDRIIEVCQVKGLRAAEAKFCGVGSEKELVNGLKTMDTERNIVICLGFKEYHDGLKFLEYEWKVLTQHVMKHTVANVVKSGAKDTLHNIVKKINEKCGGTNIEVQSPAECASLFPSRVGSKAGVSLIIGMDVCHGDPISSYLLMRGFKPDPSIIGISSNALTKNPQMYTGDFIATQGRRESVPDNVMSDHGKFLMEKFKQNHGRLPDNVILVRDGVSRSQYDMALGEFAALMEGVRAATSSDYNPRELLIIVTKEHNLRLFDKNNLGKVCNPRPGTIVDSEIVSPFWPEFLAIPQHAFAGTAKGVLVTILKDGQKDLRKFPSESLKEIKYFLHSLCFLHGCCDMPQGSPEPVSVAHDLAERGMNLSKELRNRTGDRPTVEELERKLRARGTPFEGVKITA